MKSGRKSKVKHLVDIAMTVLLLCLMAYPATGETLHEWFGVAMTALLILHHILNRRWYASVFKGSYNAYRVVTLTVNTLLLASIALNALCGMAMSAHAVPFLYGFLPVSFARRVHLSLSHWSFALMAVHLGLHIPALSRALRWKRGVKTAVAAVLGAAACCGVWAFFKNGVPNYLFFRAAFAFFDSGKPGVLVFAEQLSIMLLFAYLGAVCAFLLLKKRRSRGRPVLPTAVLFLLSLCLLSGCGAPQTEPAAPATTPAVTASDTTASTEPQKGETAMLQMTIQNTPVAVQWESNDAVRALQALCENGPLTVKMSMYGDFEQVGPLGQTLPHRDTQTTTNPGDIVLYAGSQLVVFYGSNSWAYTRLGHITDQSDAQLQTLLGKGDVVITLTAAA